MLNMPVELKRYQEGLDYADLLLGMLPGLNIMGKVKVRKGLKDVKEYCLYLLWKENLTHC